MVATYRYYREEFPLPIIRVVLVHACNLKVALVDTIYRLVKGRVREGKADTESYTQRV
jgi:hypothetical protein